MATLPFITLITASLKPRKCPYLGRYTVTGVARDGARQLRRTGAGTAASRDALCAEDFESLVVGCRATDTMEFHSSCSSESISAYSCHGSWEDNGTNYLIASPLSRKSTGARRYCFIYTENDKSLQFSSITDTCLRNINPGISGIWAFNVTVNGQCAESTAMQSTAWRLAPCLWLSAVVSVWLSAVTGAWR